MGFKLGDGVEWTSQSGGYTKSKAGLVEQVVAAGALPDRERFPHLYRSAGVGMPRDHESYVVRVPGKSAKSAGTVYWPRVALLKLPDGR